MCSTGSGSLERLDAALEWLTGDHLHGWSDGGLLDRTRELVAARNRLEAELTRTVRAADVAGAQGRDGMKTMPAWLRGHTRLASVAAARLQTAGRALQHLPAMAAAFAAGRVTPEQVDLAATAVTPKCLALAAAQGVD